MCVCLQRSYSVGHFRSAAASRRDSADFLEWRFKNQGSTSAKFCFEILIEFKPCFKLDLMLHGCYLNVHEIPKDKKSMNSAMY